MPGENRQGNREQSDQLRRAEGGEHPPAPAQQGKPATAQQGERAAAQGGQPTSEPDVLLDVPQVKVDQIYLEVENLDAHVSLRARLANLLELDVGVHARLGRVKLDIKGVEARALLKVRLQVVHEILSRALATVDQNPQILENLGKTAQQTLGPQGPVTRTVEQVGGTAQQTLGPGGAATHAVNQVGGTAQQVGGQVGGTAQQAAGQAAGTTGTGGGGQGSLQRAVTRLRNRAQRALQRLGGNANGGSKQGR